MKKKEIATQDDLLKVLDLLDNTRICYWLDGGWGVDVLAGKQTREHRDIDINFDSKYTDELLRVLKENGYEVVVDCSPVRVELYHSQLSYIDIHPFVLNNDGTAKQSNLEGGWYEFEADIFGSAVFNGRNVPCISAKGQKLFHTGYELREVDKHDIEIIKKLSDCKE
jgi:lincosamide nucleotidyltransferase A/C/D/E